MTLRVSTGFRNHRLDAAFNGAAGADFNSGTVKIYTGSQPSSADDAPTGTLLGNCTLDADAFGAAASGAVAKNGTVQDASADAAGDAGWFRIAESTDGGGSSTTGRRIDGAVTATGGGGQLTLNFVTIDTAIVITIDTLTITDPAA